VRLHPYGAAVCLYLLAQPQVVAYAVRRAAERRCRGEFDAGAIDAVSEHGTTALRGRAADR
jgi:hypothetical protein